MKSSNKNFFCFNLLLFTIKHCKLVKLKNVTLLLLGNVFKEVNFFKKGTDFRLIAVRFVSNHWISCSLKVNKKPTKAEKKQPETMT